MPPRAARAEVVHLTEIDLAKRWGLTPQVVAARRRNGDDMPRHLPLAESATKQTIRYPLAEVEAWESERLVGPQAKVSA